MELNHIDIESIVKQVMSEVVGKVLHIHSTET